MDKKRAFVITVFVIATLLTTVAVVKEKRVAQHEPSPAQPLQPVNPTPSYPQATGQQYLIAPGYADTTKDTIRVDSSEPGIVNKIWVKPGDVIKKGQPLFQLDDENFKAALMIKKAALQKAQASLRLDEVELKGKSMHYRIAKSVDRKGAVSVEELNELENQKHIAEERTNLAKAQVEVANAENDAAKIQLQKLTALSPVDGKVLQVNIRVGQYLSLHAIDEPPVLVGNPDDIKLRVNIDEEEAWKFSPGAKAVAIVNQGAKSTEIPLTFLYLEPYVTPKNQFSNERSEQQFTRVMQVVYSFARQSAINVYSGQKMDVKIFIEGNKG